MNKEEIVSTISKRTSLPKKHIDETLNALKNLFIEVLNKGGKIKLRDFGSFQVIENKERLYKNPITKRYYYSTKKKYIKVKLYKNFKFSIK